VQIAARRLPEPPAPWEDLRRARPTALGAGPDGGGRAAAGPTPPGARLRPLPVAVGMADDACVHLDLAAGPRLITVEGDIAARARLLQALAAQLDRPGSGASVTVTDGVHPQHRGERLDTVLRELEEAAPEEHGETAGAGEFDESGRAATTVLVCAAPSPEQARRLSALAASGAAVCLADGRVAGHSWALRVDARGRVTAPELGLDADSGSAGQSRRRRRPRGPPQAAPRVGPAPGHTRSAAAPYPGTPGNPVTGGNRDSSGGAPGTRPTGHGPRPDHDGSDPARRADHHPGTHHRGLLRHTRGLGRCRSDHPGRIAGTAHRGPSSLSPLNHPPPNHPEGET
jgi:hypothetical protein